MKTIFLNWFRILQEVNEENDHININCVDPLGRSALLMAIDNENLDMVELLINYNVDTKDALLHAISEEFVEAVEMLLDHEDLSQRKEGQHVRMLAEIFTYSIIYIPFYHSENVFIVVFESAPEQHLVTEALIRYLPDTIDLFVQIFHQFEFQNLNGNRCRISICGICDHISLFCSLVHQKNVFDGIFCSPNINYY